MPAKLTREPAKCEARKRRASERHAVGCCEELGGATHTASYSGGEAHAATRYTALAQAERFAQHALWKPNTNTEILKENENFAGRNILLFNDAADSPHEAKVACLLGFD